MQMIVFFYTLAKLCYFTNLDVIFFRCFAMAIKQLPDCSAYFHDIGLNYFYQAETMHVSAKPWVEQAPSMAARAIQAVQKAISIDGNNATYWSSLGVIASSVLIDHPGLAQHAFIKSIGIQEVFVLYFIYNFNFFITGNIVHLKI